MQIEESRIFFPYLNTGKIYFNHAAISPLPIPVVNAVNDYLYLRSNTEIENYSEFLNLIQDTKSKLGKLLNCEQERIAFVDNTSNGLNILANGIEWSEGDEIILNDIEFPSNIYPFLNQRKRGIKVHLVKSNEGVVDLEQIVPYVNDRTRLISISFVQFLSGYRADLEKIGKFCEEKNIIFCVDAIQGAGVMKIDVEKFNIDFLASGSQKWMMGLQGLSFIYISKELNASLNHCYAGWTSVKNAWDLLDYQLDFKDNPDSFQNGTISAVGIVALNASLNFFEEFGFDKIEERILSNSLYLIKKLEEIKLSPIISTKLNTSLSGIVSFKSEKAEKILSYLNERKIIVALREGIIRLSPHFYNSIDDLDIVIEEISEVTSG